MLRGTGGIVIGLLYIACAQHLSNILEVPRGCIVIINVTLINVSIS